MATDAVRIAIPGFELVEELGRGATTAVYRALRGTEEYALKVRALSGPDDPARDTFRREAAILAAIRHPCLGRVFEVGDDGLVAYLVMELIRGRTLAELIEADGPLTEEGAIAVVTDVASALEAAHRVGLVHRDVAPRNVVIREDGRAVLIDFGLATQTGTHQPEDAVIGTVLYSAPEQTGMVRRPVDRRSDLYSLGALLFECLAGTPPFRSDDAAEVVRLHAVAAAPDLRAVRRDASTQIARITARLLNKDPDDRYQEAAALIGDLAALRRGALAPDAPLGQVISDEPSLAESGLVGRDHEVSALAELVAEAQRSGVGGAVVIESEPGGGKTRLVEELAHVARVGGATVLMSQLGPDNPGPLAPVARALGRFFADLEARDPDELARLRVDLHLEESRVADSLTGLSPELDRFLLPAAGSREDEWHGFAVIEVAHLLTALCEAGPGAVVLVLDNAHLLDDATHRVLAYLAPELGTIPLLLVLTCRADAHSRGVLGRLRGELGESLLRRIELSSLSDEQITQVLRRQLGGHSLDESLADEITLRANGNPAAAIEYLRAALDAGVLQPNWGTFSVDAAALASLDLPSDVLGLSLRRLETLRPATRWLLCEAAVIGASFSPELLASVTGWSIGDVHLAIGEATLARVIEQLGSDRYAFVHEGVRDNLLAGLDDEAGRRAHEQLAVALDSSGDGRVETVYEVARHYALGDVAADPPRAFSANHRAGRLALTAQADDDALDFLVTADEIAGEYSLVPPPSFHADYAAALSRRGAIAAALERYRLALSLETDAIRTASLYEAVSRVHLGRGDAALCLENARAGLEALGRPLPRNRAVLWLTTVVRFALALFVLLTRIGFGRAPSERRERLRLECRLVELAGHAVSQEHRLATEAALALRAALPANRLGPSREYVSVYSKLGILLAQAHLVESARVVVHHVRKVAEAADDPYAAALARLLEGIVQEYRGDSVQSEKLLSGSLREDARYLTGDELATGALQLCYSLALRGRLYEQASLLEEALAHGWPQMSVSEKEVTPLDFVAISLSGFVEQPNSGLERIRHIQQHFEKEAPPRLLHAGFFLGLATFHFGLGELGEPFEEAVAGFSSCRLPPWNCPYMYASFWVVQAAARVAQLLQADEEEKKRRRRLARRSLRELRTAARTPVLRAYHCAARTGYLLAVGRHKKALKVAGKGQAILIGQDAPGVEVALAMARARALEAAGFSQEAERIAVTAGRLAEDLGLASYVRWIEPDIARGAGARRYVSQVSTLSQLGRSLGSGFSLRGRDRSASPGGAASLKGATRAARQLEALLQVGAAAARVLDPEALIRMALDETARILNAERALLFLTDESTGIVRPHIGRDASGSDITEFSGYSSTVVDRVTATRQPMVLTGTEEGAALGSESAVTHGLRSILVAPLVMEDRLLGVVYLDSRLAKGIFTNDDVEILSAITSHVAFGLETARLAEMEISVETERRQREVAELLRDSMRTLGQNLEPRGVLQTTLQTASGAIAADAGAILLASGERLEVAAAVGAGVALPPEGYDTARTDQPEIAEVLRTRSPVSAGTVISDRNSPLFGLLGRAGSFVIAPLVVRDEAIGALVVISRHGDAFGETQMKIVAALASQGVVAYENAQLFTRVQALAERDELSGVANRRHFFELARRAFLEAREQKEPLSAMMLDIDHFKQVNDRYGHASGDDVIRVVAQRLTAVLGAGELLGRYGGEEFALVLNGPLEAATELAHRLRRVLADSPIPTAAGPIAVTASVGVAEMAERDVDLGRLLQRTDAALYEAKRAGRDRVAVAR